MLTSHLSAPELAELMRCPGAPPHYRGACCRSHARFLAQIENYLFVGGDRYSSHYVAGRLGVTQRTVVRIRARLRSITNGRLGAYQGPRNARRAG